MRIKDPTIRDTLAGEYVLGTLRGPARRRFAQLLLKDHTLQQAVNDWEHAFAPLINAVVPVTPPQVVWERIKTQLNPRPASTPVADPKLPFWRRLAIAASIAAVAMLTYVVVLLQQDYDPAYVAVLGASGAQPAWLMSTDAQATQIRVQALNVPAIRPGQSLELWMLPAGGKPPHSLGLLPDKPGAEIHLRVTQSLELASAQGLAVSLEPAGGSRQPGPSGPVLYQAKWLPLGKTG